MHLHVASGYSMRYGASHTEALVRRAAERGMEWLAQGKPVFGMLISADSKRSDEREERLTQATASLPSAIFWFLLATLTLTVVALGICLPRRNNRGQIMALTVITALLTTALCIIRDVDRPFDGIINVHSTAITEVERQATRDFLANHQPADLPCDDSGNKRSA
ncbi:hypothetical protein ACRAKG_00250 [Streptomyces rosealbus]